MNSLSLKSVESYQLINHSFFLNFCETY